MHFVLILLSLITITLIFFIPEILHIIIRKPAYYAATPYIIIMTVAFFLYSLIDIGTSSLFVPANKPKLRAITFGLLTAIAAIGSGIALYSGTAISIAVVSMCVSAGIAYIFMVIIAYRLFAVQLVPLRIWVLL